MSKPSTTFKTSHSSTAQMLDSPSSSSTNTSQPSHSSVQAKFRPNEETVFSKEKV
jgi:hypothetical protein